MNQNLLSESGRQQVLFRQQNTINTLELDNRSLTLEINSLRLDRRKLIQNVAVLTDNNTLLQSQLNNARAAFEREILSLKPTVERQVGTIGSLQGRCPSD